LDSPTGQWLDDGPDFYATTVFANVNASDPLARAYAIAWMNNWTYATKMQTTGYFGQLSVTRELRLQLVDGVPVLFNAPIATLNSVFTSQVAGTDQTISDSVPYKFPT